MSSSIDSAALRGSINAIRMGYAPKPLQPEDILVEAPWTRRDIDDMRYISDNLRWLTSEMKSGHPLDETHKRVLNNVIGLYEALEEKERDYLAKAGFNPTQPRVPRGNPTGGQWADTGGGSSMGSNGRFGMGKIPKTRYCTMS